MRKIIGYLFFNSIKYIVQHNGKKAILVDKEENLLFVNHKNHIIMELMKMIKL